ncbi:MAG: FAD-binding oxidoreductase, partial [Candidatus Paceibacterales bacterium]
MYKKITPSILEQLKKIVGPEFVITDDEKLKHYGHDETEDLLFIPEVVVKPRTAQEISEILKLANKVLVTVTPRAAGTGLSGGA